MTFVTADLELRLSGGATNRNPNGALGGIISATQIVEGHGVFQNLFRDLTVAELTDGPPPLKYLYRCYYLYNTNTTESSATTKVWILTDTPSAQTDVALGLDPAGVGDGVSTGVAFGPIANEATAPTGPVFTYPVNFAGGLLIGTLAPGEGHAIWARHKRIVSGPGVTAATSDPFTLAHQGTVP